MQQWMKDRDLLISETLAFAQKVAAAKSARIESPARIEPQIRVELARPKEKLSESDEIRRRMADFKATQHKFQLEREEYFKKTMARVRADSSRNALSLAEATQAPANGV